MIQLIRFFNREAAKTWIPCQDEALISIYGSDEESPAVDGTKWGAFLPLQFDDADEEKDGRVLFTSSQAKQIIKFAESLETAGIQWLFINCKGGISRSAAIALFLGEEYYHIKVFMGFRICPPTYSQYNKLVYRRLHEALYGPPLFFQNS